MKGAWRMESNGHWTTRGLFKSELRRRQVQPGMAVHQVTPREDSYTRTSHQKRRPISNDNVTGQKSLAMGHQGTLLPPVPLNSKNATYTYDKLVVGSASRTSQHNVTFPPLSNGRKGSNYAQERPSSMMPDRVFPDHAGWRPDQPYLKQKEVREAVKEILMARDEPIHTEISHRTGGVAFHIPVPDTPKDNAKGSRQLQRPRNSFSGEKLQKKPSLIPVPQRGNHAMQLVHRANSEMQWPPLPSPKGIPVVRVRRQEKLQLKEKLEDEMRLSESRRFKNREAGRKGMRKEEQRRKREAERTLGRATDSIA